MIWLVKLGKIRAINESNKNRKLVKLCKTASRIIYLIHTGKISFLDNLYLSTKGAGSFFE